MFVKYTQPVETIDTFLTLFELQSASFTLRLLYPRGKYAH
jgi:hypothetical protein